MWENYRKRLQVIIIIIYLIFISLIELNLEGNNITDA